MHTMPSAHITPPKKQATSAVVKGGQVGLSMNSIFSDLGIQMKVEIQSDSSTASSLTDRLGAGPRTKHIDTRYFLGTRTSSRWRSQHQEGAYSENCADVGSQSLLLYNNIASLQDWYSSDHGSYTHHRCAEGPHDNC